MYICALILLYCVHMMLFVYGSLMKQQILYRVLPNLPPTLEWEPARLLNYVRFRVKGQSYPGIMSLSEYIDHMGTTTLAKEVPGIVYNFCSLTPEYIAEIYRQLDQFEGVHEASLCFSTENLTIARCSLLGAL